VRPDLKDSGGRQLLDGVHEHLTQSSGYSGPLSPAHDLVLVDEAFQQGALEVRLTCKRRDVFFVYHHQPRSLKPSRP
jgi:hypothetical protein